MLLKTPFRFVNGVYYNFTRRDYNHLYTVTYLHSLHASLFNLSAVVFAYSASLSLKHLNSLQLFFTYELPVTVSYRELLTVKVKVKSQIKVTLRLTVSQPVSLGVEPHLRLMTRYLLLFDSYGLVFCGAPSLTRGRVCLLYMLLAFASGVFFWFESLGSPDHILLSQI
jgi:hypothetical protein